MYDIPYKSSLENSLENTSSEQVVSQTNDNYYKLKEPIQTDIKMPQIPGQTTEEIIAPEPLQQKVDTTIEAPSSNDIYDKGEDTANFGSNLRHPESMVKAINDDFSLENEMASGTLNNKSSTNDNDFYGEMAQNGGEFMKGINAYDSSDTGTMFSSL